MENLLLDLSMLLVCAAVLACLAVLLKQPVIIAYILSGILIGPWGFGLIRQVEFIETISHLGITLLLFLAGLCLHPQKLLGSFQKTSLITLANCAASFVIAFFVSVLFNFSVVESVYIGLALMFSSTILVIKLLPTTKLHQKRMGAVCISILIMQDLLAIAVLAFVRTISSPQGTLISFAILLVKLFIFLVALVVFERYVLRNIMAKVERIHELLFILGLAWCFGVASISNQMGLFYEAGAFFAGVVLARHRISFFLSQRLKPLRDFFLVLFFFAMGCNLNLKALMDVLVPSIVLALVFILVKPWVFKNGFLLAGEEKAFSKETGLRLGQLSEFSLLIALLAFELGHITSRASLFIQLTTILTFVFSSYIVVFKYPTPIGTSEALNRD